ncbi:hypothetical protein Aspvir_004453 [Aspergillus viridinutans]|uniref:Aminoglycoside phosphotransferase domain-containing protein n=1 Tax=Aspergillus viridinutans TaxID=75553 RepID=A0A9P3BQ25_ASPVI|nr:uncharacterized protein Aspvir_004453 [Aspergillus viridinutans]GIK00428.1 hypothetical protein Aspvir_004453 [Aspergillus viridinutans]
MLELPGLRRPQETGSVFPLKDNDIANLSRDQLIHALDAAPPLWENGGVRIVRVSSGVVVKYGSDVHIWEAANMRFVAQHTNIRLPTVLDAWETNGESGHEDTICYIAMSYIRGQQLDEVWPTLSDASRCDIQQQLHQFIQELRLLKSDKPGPIGGGVSNGAFFTDYGAGPFVSQEDMERWFDGRLAVCRQFGLVDQAQEGFRGLFRDLAMCHMDLHPRNIILDGRGKVWLIDWAFAGMYPAYFETASILRNGWTTYFGDWLGQGDRARFGEEINRLFSISFALTTGALCQPTETTHDMTR